MPQPRYVDTSRPAIRSLKRQFVPFAERMAAISAEEITADIEITDVPSRPGAPPHSTGPYKNSWKPSKARIRDDVAAIAYSKAKAGTNDDRLLGPLLEYGTEKMPARPHIRVGLARAADRIRSELL